MGAWHWILHWLGLDNASGPQYLWWSGFVGDLTIFAGVAVFFRHKNCHTKGCWRIGHPNKKGVVVCRKHVKA